MTDPTPAPVRDVERQALMDRVRKVAHSLPPSDFGSHRAMIAVADLVEAETSRLRKELEEARAALSRDRDALLTILSDSAAQVDRARPADERDGPSWNGPGDDWWESFEETVHDQLFPGSPSIPRASLPPPPEDASKTSAAQATILETEGA